MSSLEDKNRAYWRGLTAQGESPSDQDDLGHADEHDGVSRRRFVQLMGASMALAGAACRWEKEELRPFAARPVDYVPGKTKQFATAMDLAGFASGVVATSFDGRPIKIEGNAVHPASLGASSVFAQASILELYDPDRSTQAMRYGGTAIPLPQDAAQILREVGRAARASAGAGVAILAEATSSVSLRRLRASLHTSLPQASWHTYETVNNDNERMGSVLAFGAPHRVHLNASAARIIVALDADILGQHPSALRTIRDFAQGRRPEAGPMKRLYALESRFSATGAQADHRLPLRSEQVKEVLAALVAVVVDSGKVVVTPAQRRLASAPATALTVREDVAKFIKVLAKDLVGNQGAGAVAVGWGQPPEVHALAHHLNAMLGNAGTAVTYTVDPDPDRPSCREAIETLSRRMRAGEVETLIILGGNPVYNAPVGAGFAAALEHVRTSVHLSLYQDETSRACTYHLPRAHCLEAWGDARAYDGTLSVCQPLIDPLYPEARSPLQCLAALLGDAGFDARAFVQETITSVAGTEQEASAVVPAAAAWRRALHDGVVAGAGLAQVVPALRPLSGAAMATGPRESDGVEVTVWPDPSLFDGRFANSSWLQELPDFMTKLCWDNAALVSPATAKAFGIRHGDVVRLSKGTRRCEIAVYVMPGQAPQSVALFLGYGRTAAGKVGGSAAEGVVSPGFDVTPLVPSGAANFVAGVTVTPTGRRYPLVSTQDHHAIDSIGAHGRDERLSELVREADLPTYREHPDFARHVVEHPPLRSLFTERPYEGHKWAMAIDLSACVGCNACSVACQAENNIPVVGKEQVGHGREMSWIRIDRYFQGDAERPAVVSQPVACQQCEMAPCEQVCPVAATSHSSEGLNDMVYNRCIGTRYCANNCPYKVRRFNFFNYHKDLEDPRNSVLTLLHNPEVTVRSRGVMEKCTYCVQRIAKAKIEAKNARRALTDGSIKTACQQVCPASAIVFGDLNDSKSQVAAQHENSRAYFLLEELNNKPRTAYLAKIRNPHPELG